MLVEQIAQIPLFSALPQEVQEQLANTLQPCEFPTGFVLMREGEHDNHFYILLEGEMEVIKALETPDERLLAVKGRGAMFGEMSLFNPEGGHTASVRTRTACRAIEMTRQEFDALLHNHPSLVYEVVRRISKRLEESENTTIIDLREKNRQLTQAYQELQAAQEQLIIKEKLEKELAIAREIQESILPDELPRLPGFEVGALTIPARAVGGDYYDFIRLDEDRFGLVVGDACDKGIPAALFITLTNSLVHIEAPRNPSPQATLRQVNHHLVEMNRSGMFVTMLYGILEADGHFEYCRAGHPHPLVLDGDLRPVEAKLRGAGVRGTGMPLGLMDESQLDARSVDIPPGGLVVVFSDGLLEALDASGAEFGIERLVAALPEVYPLPARNICQEIWQRVQAFSGIENQTDDFTVVVIKRASG